MAKTTQGIKANNPKKASPIPKATKTKLIEKVVKKNHVITTIHEFIINNRDFGYDSISIYIVSLTVKLSGVAQRWLMLDITNLVVKN